MSEWSRRSCRPLPAGAPPMSEEAVKRAMSEVAGWTLADSGKEIRRELAFENYYETIAFVNAVAWIAHREDHHPELEIGYDRCLVRYATHSVGGLSENDFICAAKVNEAVPGPPGR